jgi:Domain of unknown function (DUF1707)
MAEPDLRASDDDRRRVVSELERHTADGRLSLDEFSERVSRVYTAATHGDLARITHDLPETSTAQNIGGDHRYLLIAFVLALVTIVALGIVFAIFKP